MQRWSCWNKRTWTRAKKTLLGKPGKDIVKAALK